jgi:hypothetical protein
MMQKLRNKILTAAVGAAELSSQGWEDRYAGVNNLNNIKLRTLFLTNCWCQWLSQGCEDQYSTKQG